MLSFAALRFPRPGTYAWQVACGNEVVNERRIVVRQVGA